jgi:hypothetical protein
VRAKEAEMKVENTSRRKTQSADERKAHAAEEPPPIGGTWKTLYAVVLLNLTVLVVLFYIFTRAFR